ncbi:MAG: flagellar hook-basal body complex protein, partial [Candidatus Sumerlaeota bacterium]
MKELYVAVSGTVSRERQLTTIATNLANINTTGYKKDTSVFEVRLPEVDWKAMEDSADKQLNLPRALQRDGDYWDYVRTADTFTDHRAGAMRETGERLDVAIQTQNNEVDGSAFFMVQTPGGVRYTRMGNFKVNVDNEL